MGETALEAEITVARGRGMRQHPLLRLILLSLGLWGALFAPAAGKDFLFRGDYPAAPALEGVRAGETCRVTLAGARLLSPLAVPEGAVLALQTAPGTTNTLAAIEAPRARVCLGGEGTLVLKGNDNLLTAESLVMTSGTLVVELASGGSVHAAALRFSAPSALTGGRLMARVAGDRAAALRGEKHAARLVFGGTFALSAVLAGPEAHVVRTKGALAFDGGNYAVTMPRAFTGCARAKAFKSDKLLRVTDGNFACHLPAEGSEIFSSDDAIVIDGGRFNLVAHDDCLSARNAINLNGGDVSAVSLADDVFDSNGEIVVTGGRILAYTTAKGHEAFDVDPMKTVSGDRPHRLVLSGGTIFATGGKKSAWPSTLEKTAPMGVYAESRLVALAYSEKDLTLMRAEGGAVTARLPRFPEAKCSILAACPKMTGAPKVSERGEGERLELAPALPLAD